MRICYDFGTRQMTFRLNWFYFEFSNSINVLQVFGEKITLGSVYGVFSFGARGREMFLRVSNPGTARSTAPSPALFSFFSQSYDCGSVFPCLCGGICGNIVLQVRLFFGTIRMLLLLIPRWSEKNNVNNKHQRNNTSGSEHPSVCLLSGSPWFYWVAENRAATGDTGNDAPVGSGVIKGLGHRRGG